MKLIFSAVSLLVVLAVVGLLVKHQLHATTGSSTNPALAAAASQAGVSLPADGAPQQQAQNIEKQIQEAANKALQQGAARASEADQ